MKKHNKGFTYLELLLYITILMTVIGSIITVAWNVIGGNEKNVNQQEIYSQARFISEKLKYKIRNASNIQNVSNSQIVLNDSDGSKNPTTINCSSGNITIQEGTGPVLPLNSNSIVINSCLFTNYSSADSKSKNIQINLGMKNNYGGSRHEYNLPIVNLQTSVEVRNN